MAQNTKNKLRKVLFFLNEGAGNEPGIYTQEESLKLPEKDRKKLQTVSSALREGKIQADMASAKSINDFDFYAPADTKTGKQKQLRGVQEGLWDPATQKAEKPSEKKIANALRDKLQEMKESTSL